MEPKQIKTITLSSVTGTTTFDDSISQIVVEATVTPADATNQNLYWKVMNGADKVTLSPDDKRCTLTLKDAADNGEVLLRAEAQDESGVYGELTLMVKREQYYTINFYSGDPWDGTAVLLQTVEVKEGEIPVYTGPIPTQEAPYEMGDEYVYVFTGEWYWLSPNGQYGVPEYGILPATENRNYYADFQSRPRICTVTFYDDLTWETISEQQVENGSSVTPPDAPIHEGYTFLGWYAYVYNYVTGTDTLEKADFSRIVKNIWIYALYEENPHYTITFANWNGEVLQSSEVEENTLPEYTGATPERPEDEQYIYTFNGWSPAIVAATADATYTAQYISKDKHEGIGEIPSDQVQSTKLIRNGLLYIERNGKLYNAQGALME